ERDVRGRSHQDDLARGERERAELCLWHVSEHAGYPPARPRRDRGATHEHGAGLGLDQSQQRAEERRLAAAVGAEQAEHLAGREAEADVATHNPSRIAERQPLDREPHGAAHCQPRREAASTQMKNGAPMNAVSTPSGISMRATVRASVSTPSRYPAPSRIEAGRSRLKSGPTRNRARCGTRSPIQPTTPLIDTTPAVMSVAAAMTARRSRRVSAPSARASSSPTVITLIRQRSSTSGINPSTTLGVTALTSPIVTEARLPRSQKVIAGSWLYGSARYLSRDTSEPSSVPITMPASTRIRMESWRRSAAPVA